MEVWKHPKVDQETNLIHYMLFIFQKKLQDKITTFLKIGVEMVSLSQALKLIPNVGLQAWTLWKVAN